MSDTPRDRFNEKVAQTDTCWMWTAYRDVKGYGRFSVRGTLRLAHRVSWELTNGPIPDGLHVLHKCDVRACVNPDHLFLGTNADNNRDMMEKGRNVVLRGEKAGSSKLTESDVRAIRLLLAAGKRAWDIAPLYGVGYTTIRAIEDGRNWAWLDKLDKIDARLVEMTRGICEAMQPDRPAA